MRVRSFMNPLPAIGLILALFPGLLRADCPQEPGAGESMTADALSDLGKEAFFSALEASGASLSEEALRLAESGRGAAGARALEMAERRVAAAELVGFADDILIDPIKAYLEAPDGEKADAVFKKFVEGATKVLFPEVGLMIDGGRLVIGGSTWAVEEMYSEGRRQQAEATIFGRGPDTILGSINNLMAEDPFFSSGPVARRGLAPHNVAKRISTESELRTLWFTHYRAHLIGGPMGLGNESRAEVEQALKDGWPHLRKYWSFRRASLLLNDMRYKFGRKLSESAQAAKKNAERLARGTPCPEETAATTTGPALSAAVAAKWNGTWVGQGTTLVLSGSGGGLSGQWTWTSGPGGSTSKGSLRCGQVDAARAAQCKWDEKYEDKSKTVDQSGDSEMALSGDSLHWTGVKTAVKIHSAPGWDWKIGGQWAPGAKFDVSLRRQN